MRDGRTPTIFGFRDGCGIFGLDGLGTVRCLRLSDLRNVSVTPLSVRNVSCNAR